MTTGVNIVPILVWDNRLPPELFTVYNGGGLQNFNLEGYTQPVSQLPHHLINLLLFSWLL